MAWDVSKSDAVELHFARDGRHGDIVCLFGFLLLRTVDDISESFDREGDLLKILPTLREAHKRRGDIAGDDAEGDELAKRQLALDDKHRSIPEDCKVTQAAKQSGRRVHRSGCENGMEACTDKAGVAFLPLPARGLLDVASFERLDAGESFDEVGLGFGALFRTAADLCLQDGGPQKRDTGHEWNNHQGDKRQLHIVEKHDCHIDDGKNGIQTDCESSSSQELADVLEFMQAGRHLAHGTALKIAEREFVEVVHDPRTDSEVDAV